MRLAIVTHREARDPDRGSRVLLIPLTGRWSDSSRWRSDDTLTPMVSNRLQAWIRQHFGPAEVESVLALLTHAVPGEEGDTPDGIERVQAAVVLLSGGNSQRFLQAAALAVADWRDVLVAAQLADDDWRAQLNDALGISTEE